MTHDPVNIGLGRCSRVMGVVFSRPFFCCNAGPPLHRVVPHEGIGVAFWQIRARPFRLFRCPLCTNIANDYFDYLQGTNSCDAIGGSRVIEQVRLRRLNSDERSSSSIS